MESCPLVISHILAEFHPERATYTTLQLSKSAQTFTVGFVKLLSTHPIHIVVWGNFPFKEIATEYQAHIAHITANSDVLQHVLRTCTLEKGKGL